MSKVITVLGGNGYIGSRCVYTLLENTNDVKVNVICRSGKINLDENIDQTKVNVIKGDCLHPETFKEAIKESTGFIHAIGVLFDSDESYQLYNKQSCTRVAELANELNPNKPNFVFVSAERGIPFPLSLKYGGYIKSKKEAEQTLLQDYSNINTLIVRPGFVKSKIKKWTGPLALAVAIPNIIERQILNRLSTKIGDSLQLPARAIDVDVLAKFAVAGALGNLKDGPVLSNDYMLEKSNLDKLNLH